MTDKPYDHDDAEAIDVRGDAFRAFLSDLGPLLDGEPRPAVTAALEPLLHNAYPALLAKLAIIAGGPGIAAVELMTERGQLYVTARELQAAVDRELTRRWAKAAHGQGRGT